MAKYNKEMVQACADWVRENGLIDFGGATLTSFCKAMSIDNKTYYSWMNNPEFSEAIKKAKEAFRDGLEKDIVKSLSNAAKGYEYTQTISNRQVRPSLNESLRNAFNLRMKF